MDLSERKRINRDGPGSAEFQLGRPRMPSWSSAFPGPAPSRRHARPALRLTRLLLIVAGIGAVPAYTQEPAPAAAELRVLPARSPARKGEGPLRDHRLHPARPTDRACLYLHGRGKHVDAAPGGPIAALVAAGVDVLAVDLRGFGETAMDGWRTRPVTVAGDNGAEYHLAFLLGRSLVGDRAEDILSARAAYATLLGRPAAEIELVALDDATIPALHAAAVAPSVFSAVHLVRTLDSGERVIDVPVPLRQLEHTVHGALRAYDLPELRALAGRVEIAEAVDATGRTIPRP